MKIVKYIGGLGNQMFIYAFSFALKRTFGQDVFVDTHYYKTRNFHNGLEIQKIFGVALQEASLMDILKMAWYFPNYWIDFHLLKYLPNRKNTIKELSGQKFNAEIMKDSSDKYYDGYWQSFQYFDKYRTEILKEFSFPPFNEHENVELSRLLKNDRFSIGIHIRRGDYLKNWKYQGLCGIDYYKKAIDYIFTHVESPHFYLFSDDTDWVTANICPLLKGANYRLVNWNKGSHSYRDMQLMSMCKNLIIANSSFSWWAAYLNQNNPIVIAPEKWTNSYTDFRIQYPNWITF